MHDQPHRVRIGEFGGPPQKNKMIRIQETIRRLSLAHIKNDNLKFSCLPQFYVTVTPAPQHSVIVGRALRISREWDFSIKHNQQINIAKVAFCAVHFVEVESGMS